MNELDVVVLLSAVVAGAAPIVLATLGETITERAGVIKLSLDGTILLSAMTAFAVAFETQSLLMGFLAAALVGALTAATVAVFSIYLGQSQVAVGFVLTLTTRDLAYFLGNPYAGIHFAFLQILGISFQGWLPSVPAQVFQVAPFPLMIFTLVLMHLAQKESLLQWAEHSPWKKTLLWIFAGTAPAALGKPHRAD